MKNNAAQKSALHKSPSPILFGAAAAACIVYCFIVYALLQKTLIPGAGELTGALQAASYIILPALLIAGLFHIYLLGNLLKNLTGRFLNSLVVLLAIVSGIFLLSDVTLLSDIGKEYSQFDVSGEWALLYVFTIFHIAVITAGTAILQKRKAPQPQETGGNEAVYISVHHIALIAGVLGLVGVFLAMSGAIVPLRFAAGFMAVLSALALIPLFIILIYWRLRAKKRPGKTVLDEKQVTDTAFAGLTALLAALPGYILVCALDLLTAVHLPVSSFIFLLFFAQLIVFSSVVLAKNR